jgi:hypothetical protein
MTSGRSANDETGRSFTDGLRGRLSIGAVIEKQIYVVKPDGERLAVGGG